MSEYGTVTFGDKTFQLTEQPDFSGRCLLDWQTKEGYSHFVAPAVDAEGNKYQVEWVRKLRYDNGEEIEDLSDNVLDWEKADLVVAL